LTAVLLVERLSVEARTTQGAWTSIARDVDVAVREGEVLALIGESGAGKSTVALAAMGYARPGTRFVSGTIRLGSTDVLRLKPHERRGLRGRRVAYVPQSAAASLNPSLTIGEQVAEPLVEHGMMSRHDALHRALELMHLLQLPNPELLAKRYPHQISGGQQQRVMIAMALTCSPELLVLDEPTTALDVTTQVGVLKAIKDAIRLQKNAVLYVSHDLAVVTQLADGIIVMRDGVTVERGRTPDVLFRPSHAYTRMLLDAVRPSPATATEQAALVERPSPDAHIPVLSARLITASYGGERRRSHTAAVALDGVNLSISAGEVVGLVGESGSGKSTLARVISGLHKPSSGEIDLDGRKLNPSVRKRTLDEQRRIQIVFQSPDASLNPEQRVSEAIGRPLDLYFKLGRAARRSRIAELLGLVGLDPALARRFPGELSGGQKQRISLARAFAARPDVLLCDEILSALDTVVAASILDLIRALRKSASTAYLFISHDLSTVAAIADRVVVLYAGRICEEGRTRDIFAKPSHPYTAMLLASVPELRPGWLEEVLQKRGEETDGRATLAPHDTGCAFRNRCPLRVDGLCDHVTPPARSLPNGQIAYCHRPLM
jgi:peptide/nickel transport system ATP-binding protein